ncbi:MAG TPA: FAD-dependent oxidoreductase [Nitrolancea sp.]|nr:FAD-dependent oxidoreductase [Nitrolancea sp.]
MNEIGDREMQTVAVIGAGVVGASVAFRLAQAGAKVILIDRGEPGHGTSASSFAWANANQKTPRDYFELNFAGLREHKRLRDELGDAPWLHDGGNLVYSANEADVEARVARLTEWDYAAEWMTAAEVNASLESNIRFSDPSSRIAFFPDECWVNAPQLAVSLVERARRLGAETRFGTALNAVELTDGRVRAISIGQSERIEIDALVNTAGPGADKVATMVGRTLPLAPTSGLLVRVEVSPAPVQRIVHLPQIHIRPDGDGFVLLQHDDTDDQVGDRTTIDTNHPLVRELLTRATTTIAGFDDARIVDARIGIRPIPRDGRSCVGGIAYIDGYYEAVTHSGVTLGPLLGRLLANEIVNGERDTLLAPFSPNRFV